MEFKNEVQLRGILMEIKRIQLEKNSMYILSVQTQDAYRTRSGESIIREDLHTCKVFPGKTVTLDKLKTLRKGMIIYIKGQLRYEPNAHVFIQSLTISKGGDTAGAGKGIYVPVKI